jgi:3-phosphoshikimate 1-carboxyvinyltransferase
MIITIKPARFLRGSVDLPASKSYSIRAFLISACGGVSSIISPSDCDDAKVAMRVARQLGARLIRRQTDRWVVRANMQQRDLRQINVGESGTVLRLLLPLLPLRCRRARVVGVGTLRGRPNFHLTEMLRRQGVEICGQGRKESVPINFSGGDFHPGTMVVSANLSSQFISALLIACPQLTGDTHLLLKGKKIVSEDYIAMTRQVLALSGVRCRRITQRHYAIKGGQTFRGLKNFRVPADLGLAGFLLAAGAILPSRLTLKGHFPSGLIQADGAILGFLKSMGASFDLCGQSIKMSGPYPLRGGQFSLKTCPDLVPVMAILALFAKGKTRLYDIQHVRIKESDRISDLRSELLKIGARIEERKNEMTIFPQLQYRRNVLLDSHGDHRLAMAFSILGLKLSSRIKDAQCVAKSYPGFYRDLRSIGIGSQG